MREGLKEGNNDGDEKKLDNVKESDKRRKEMIEKLRGILESGELGTKFEKEKDSK